MANLLKSKQPGGQIKINDHGPTEEKRTSCPQRRWNGHKGVDDGKRLPEVAYLIRKNAA